MANVQGAGGVGNYDADKKERSYINNVQGTNDQVSANSQKNWWNNPVNTTHPSVDEQAAEWERQAGFRYTTGTPGTVGAPDTTEEVWPGTTEEVWPGAGGVGSSRGSSRKGYKAAVLPSATSQEAYINAMYDANAAKQKAALEEQYIANVGTLDRQAAKIPGQYDTAANQAAAQAAINRANFNEQAAATGLNTGATGQAALAQNNALLGEVSAIRKNQADALKDVEAQRASLMQQYQAAIKAAIANNEADRAAALYNEAKRVDESLVSTAVNQATENYRAWQAKYG